jgi:proteic killer suppression protein
MGRTQFLTDINKMFTMVEMIKSFANRETEKIFSREHSRKLPGGIQPRALMRLIQIDAATRIEDLRLPPSNRLEPLKHDRKGQWSVRINDQWRIRFRFEAGDAFDVEIVDYH